MMVAKLIASALRQVLRLLLLTCRSERANAIELLVLRQELDVLRRQVPHPKTRLDERLVLSVLNQLRPTKERLSSLVTPDTLRRWHRELVKAKWRRPHRLVSHKAIPPETQLLVWRMANENNTWGHRRIHGEMLKIGIKISPTSIRRILDKRPHGGPQSQTWKKFLRAQASTMIACDLFTVESITRQTLHVLFFIELNPRRAVIAGVIGGAAT